MIGGYDVVLSSTFTGGRTVTTGTWTVGSAGTQVTFDGANAFGDNDCDQDDTPCWRIRPPAPPILDPTLDFEAAITVSAPNNIVFRRVNLVVSAPPAGFGPVAGIKCSATAPASCADLILDRVGLRLDGGAQGAVGVDGSSFDARAA